MKLNIRFQKSKYPIFKICFWILILCSIAMIFLIIKTNIHCFSIKDIEKYAKPITINVTLNKQTKDSFFICFDNYCKTLDDNSAIGNISGYSNIKSVQFNQKDEYFRKNKINNIYFAYPEKIKNAHNLIKEFHIYIDKKLTKIDFENIEKYEKKVLPIAIDKTFQKSNYIIYKLNNINLYSKDSNKYINAYLSLLFNWQFYVIPYCWLLIALIIFIFNKDVYKINPYKKSLISLSIIFLYIFTALIVYILAPKICTQDSFMNFIKNDIKTLDRNDEIHIFSKKNESYFKKYPRLNKRKITWHKIDSKITKIVNEDFTKNNKNSVIYMDSTTANIDLISINHAKMQIYKTNYTTQGKLKIFKEQQ